MAKEKQTAKVDEAKQAKLKKQTAVVNEDQAIKEANPATLRPKLSNKNADYVFHLQKELEKQGQMDEAAAKSKVDPLLPEILIAQRKGQPANGLYLASPRVKAHQILHPEVKPKSPLDLPFWQRGVDAALLYVVIFLGIFGVIDLFSKGHNDRSQMGILNLVLVGALMGVFMAKYNEWVIPTPGKKVRLQWGRIIFGLLGMLIIAAAVLWIFNLPGLKVINPVLPGPYDLVIAAVFYGIRWLFRRQYHIVGSVLAPNPRQSKNK